MGKKVTKKAATLINRENIEGQIRETCQDLETTYTNWVIFFRMGENTPTREDGLIGSERGIETINASFHSIAYEPGWDLLSVLPQLGGKSSEHSADSFSVLFMKDNSSRILESTQQVMSPMPVSRISHQQRMTSNQNNKQLFHFS